MSTDKKIKVLFETSVLSGGHSTRGIGTYGRLLLENLEDIDELEVHKSSTLSKDDSLNPDIIHYPFFDLFFDTLPLSPFKNKVVTIHDVIPLIYPEQYKPGIKGKIRFKKQKMALKSTAAVITDSHASKEDIINYLSVPEDKIHVVYLAANPNLQAQKDELISRVKMKNKLAIKIYTVCWRH